MLFDAGLSAGKDYEVSYVGKHDAVALNIANGNGDVGWLEQGIPGRDDPEKADRRQQNQNHCHVRRIDRISVGRSIEFEARTARKIKHAFWDLKDKEILKNLKNADGYAPVTDASYEGVRKVVEKVDKMEAAVKAEK